MKAISPHTRLSPEKRVHEASIFIEQFNENEGSLFEIVDSKKPLRVDGYYLKQPKIEYFGKDGVYPNEKGSFRHKAPLHSAKELTNVVFIYSTGNRPEKDDDDIERNIGLITAAAK